MKIDKVLEELKSIVEEPKENEVLELEGKNLQYQIREYKRQEEHLQEICVRGIIQKDFVALNYQKQAHI